MSDKYVLKIGRNKKNRKKRKFSDLPLFVGQTLRSPAQMTGFIASNCRK